MFVIGLWTFFRALLFGSAAIALQNLALRHQLAVLQRSVRRPRLSRWDRILWVWLSRVWTDWRASLVLVQPATVLAWHRQGFQIYWQWKSRRNPVGRPKLDGNIRHLDHCLILNEVHLRRLYAATSATTTPRGHTNRSTTTVLSHARCIRPSLGAWCPPRRSVGSITSTRGRPDGGRSPGPRSAVGVTHHPPVVACLGFAGGRAWQSLIAVAPDADSSCPPSRVRGSERSGRSCF
jgi:hypothetical protein